MYNNITEWHTPDIVKKHNEYYGLTYFQKKQHYTCLFFREIKIA